MLTRRKFLATAAYTVAAARLHAQGHSKAQVALSIPNEATGPHMPIDFVGLSYEVQQLADPTFFSAQNGGLIREFKALSSTGVLRLGGNTSEFAYWKPTPNSPEPEHPQVREVTGEPKARYYAVTVEAVGNLAEFLRATGWTCVYGTYVGLSTNTPARAAEEAAFASPDAGQPPAVFPDRKRAGFVRPAPARSENVVRQDVPGRMVHAGARDCSSGARSKPGMPDVARKVSWLTEIAGSVAFGPVLCPT